tara:strand:- start:499 stop:774 length:276 start_codon:yes stop_codon:yes gene_type:complete
MATNFNQANTYALTKKGGNYSPRVGNQNNTASWQGVQAALAKGPATGAAIVAAIQVANPNNQGNAIGYATYAVRSGWLVQQAAPKGKAKSA